MTVARMVSEERDEATAGIGEELAAAIADLDDAEQSLVARAVRKAKTDRGERVALTALDLVNEILKIDLEHDDFSVFQNIATMTAPPVVKEYPDRERIALPADLLALSYPLGEVIAKRGSRRDYSKGPLTLVELASLLHLAYGVRRRGLVYNLKDFPFRFVPSTGGLQAVEVYLSVNAVEGLDQGLYHYNPLAHALEVLERGNFRRKAVRCCIRQDWIDAASIVLYLTCDMNKVYWKYGRRGYRFVHVDLGIVAHTLHLVATALRLRSCMVAGYLDDAVNDLLRIDGRREFAGLLLAVGRKPWEPRSPTGEEAAADPAGDPALEG